MLNDATFDVPPSQWEAAIQEAREAIIRSAKRRQPIYYSSLVNQISSVRLEAHDPRLFHMLGQIASDEDKAGRGLLTAVVVHKHDGQPGLGFYELAKTRGRDISDQLKCWSTELRAVFDYWADHKKSGRPAPIE